MNFAQAYDPIRALTAAWKVTFRAPLPLLVCGVLLLVIHLVLGLIWLILIADHHGHPHPGELVVLLSFFGSAGLLSYLVGCWLSLGLVHTVEKTVATGRAQVGDVFQTRDRYFEMVCGGAVFLLVSAAAVLPFVLIALSAVFAHGRLHMPAWIAVFGALVSAAAYFFVYLYVILGVSLWRQAIALEGLGPLEAIRRSWHLANGHRLRLALFWIVLSLVKFVGFWGGLLMCVCGVVPGVVLSITLVQVAQFESYLVLVRADDYARSWLAGATAAPAAPLNATIG